MANGDNKDILIRVRADLARAIKEMDGLKGELNETGKAGKKAGKELTRTEESIEFLKRAAGAYLTLQFAKRIFLQADAFQSLSVRIRTATKDTGNYDRVWHDLLETSTETGAAFRQIIGLFQNVDRSAPELDATTAEILRLTEAVAQLGVISGASDVNQKAGLHQFSQMLSSPVARAEEFNSLLENIPEVANRIAHGMDMTVGELRAAVLAGTVLSRDVFDSLLAQTDEISKEFAMLPVTASRGWSAAVTAASAQLKRLDDALNTTSGWGSILQQLAIVMTPDSAEEDLGERIGALFDDQARLEDLVKRLSNAPEAETWLQGLLQENLLEDAKEDLAAVNAELERIREQRRKAREEAAAKGSEGADPDKPVEADPAVVESIIKLTQKFKEQAATLGATNEQVALYRTTIGDLKGATDAQKQSLIEAAVALDKKTAAQTAAKEAEQNAAADQEYIQSLENEMQLLGMNERAQAQFAAVAKLTTAATDEQREAVMQLAGAMYDLEQATPVKQFADLQAEYRGVLDLLSQDVQRIQADVNAGLLSEAAGRRQIIDLQRATAQQLETEYLPALMKLVDTLGPDGEKAVNQLIAAIQRLRTTSNPIISEIRAGMESAFAGFVQQSLQDIDSVSEAFEGLGDAILNIFYRIIAEMAAQAVVQQIFSMLGIGQVQPGSSGTRQPIRTYSTPVGVNHTGGIAGVADAGKRVVPTSMFAGAPRFHTGGIIGRGEVPIIAKRGEGVFTEAQMAALAPAGGNTVVEIHHHGSEQPRVEKSRGSDGRELIRVITGENANDIARGGANARAIESRYGLRPVGR